MNIWLESGYNSRASRNHKWNHNLKKRQIFYQTNWNWIIKSKYLKILLNLKCNAESVSDGILNNPYCSTSTNTTVRLSWLSAIYVAKISTFIKYLPTNQRYTKSSQNAPYVMWNCIVGVLNGIWKQFTPRKVKRRVLRNPKKDS